MAETGKRVTIPRISSRPVVVGTWIAENDWYQFWEDLWRRTGGDNDTIGDTTLQVTANVQAIADNATAIAANVQAIADNATAIADSLLLIQANILAIQANTDAINLLDSDVSGIAADVATNASDIASNLTQINVLKARTITAGVGLDGGGSLTSDITLDLADTAVTPGSYEHADLTVDQQGRIVAASNGTDIFVQDAFKASKGFVFSTGSGAILGIGE